MRKTHSDERKMRDAIIESWSQDGKPERPVFPAEKNYRKLLENKENTRFKTLPIHNYDDVTTRNQISYLIDGLDSIESRVDNSFDSFWKALEIGLKTKYPQSITDATWSFSQDFHKKVDINLVWNNAPDQVFELLYKRIKISQTKCSTELNVGPNEANPYRALKKKLKDNPASEAFFDRIKEYPQYNEDNGSGYRKGWRFLKYTLINDSFKYKDKNFSLDNTSKLLILTLGLLYNFRNTRFHGKSFSPFISSKASIRTYTVPYFCLITTYYLLVTSWEYPEDISTKNFLENIDSAKKIFEKYWS